jgi:isoprenylcysteine carboxyl methyltransferase (ICMT) family protein YpbQ
VFGLLLGILLALKVPGTAITGVSVFLFWLGVLLMYAGIALRLYAIAVLGTFFTATVAVAPERHPSYSSKKRGHP